MQKTITSFSNICIYRKCREIHYALHFRSYTFEPYILNLVPSPLPDQRHGTLSVNDAALR